MQYTTKNTNQSPDREITVSDHTIATMAGFPNKLKRLVSKKSFKKDDSAGEPNETKPAQASGGKEVETIKSIKTGGSGSTAASTSNKNNAATAASAVDKPTKSEAAVAAAPKAKAAGSTKPAPLKTSKTQSSQGTMQKTSAAKTPNQKRPSKPPSVTKPSTAGADGKGSAGKASGRDAITKLSGKGSADNASRNLVKASTKRSSVKKPANDKAEEESIKELDGIIKELSISADIAVPTSSDHFDGVSEYSGGSAKSLESESEVEETDEEEGKEVEESKKAASVAKNSQSFNGGVAKAVTGIISVPPKIPSFQSENSVKTEKVDENVVDDAEGKSAKVGNELIKESMGTGITPAKESAKKSVKSNVLKAAAKASGQKSKGGGSEENATGNVANGSALKGPARSNASLSQSAKSNASNATPSGNVRIEDGIAGNGKPSKGGAKASATTGSAKGGNTKIIEAKSGVGAKKKIEADIKGSENHTAPRANATQGGDSSKPANSAESGSAKAQTSSAPNNTQPRGDSTTAEAVTTGARLNAIAPVKKKSLFSKAFKSSKGVSAKKSPDVTASESKKEPSQSKTSPDTVVATKKKSNQSGDSAGKKSPPPEVASDAQVAAAAMAAAGVEPAKDKKSKTSKVQGRALSKPKSQSKQTEAPAALSSLRAEKVSRQSLDQQLPPSSLGHNINYSHIDYDDISEEDREDFSQYSDGESIEMQRQQSGDISLYTKSTFGESMTFGTHLDDIEEDDNDTMEDSEAIKHSDVIINEPGDPSDLLMRVLYWKPQLEFGNDVIVQVEVSSIWRMYHSYLIAVN